MKMSAMRLWPRSLLGRVLLVVCGALTLAHALTLLILLRERGEQGLAMMQAYVGRDVAASIAVLDHLPASERAAWLPRLARAHYHYELPGHLGVQPAQPPARHTTPHTAQHPLAEPVRQAVAAELGPQRVGPITESLVMGDARLRLPLRLADGQALVLTLTPPRPTVSLTTMGLLLAQMLAVVGAAWWVVRLAVRPLQRLARTAEGIRPEAATHIASAESAADNESPTARHDPHLPAEVAEATRALQALQARVQAHVQERTQLLAAISHDLQTPITRMRLRTERITDAEVRTRLLDDLDGMSALVAEGLAYARSTHAHHEAPRAVDLPALLDALVCDAQDAGHDVRLRTDAAELPPFHTRVQALRRLVGNLLDNAVKFGAGQPVTLTLTLIPAATATAERVHITVDDDGPGIPEADLPAVLQPFHRLEASRSRDTGGTGLGLAIAQQLAIALGGALTLSNRPEGGLRARLSLPLDLASTH